MKLLENIIRPFDGMESIKLYDSLENVKKYLNNEHIEFELETWKIAESDPNPWTVLCVENSVYLYFAGNSKLFKIYCINNFKGSLPNGICLSNTLEEARKIDKTIRYNDDGEDFESEEGYWLEDNLDTKKVMSITIYIKELLDSNVFESLRW